MPQNHIPSAKEVQAEHQGSTQLEQALNFLDQFGPDNECLSMATLVKRTGLRKGEAAVLVEILIGRDYLRRLNGGSFTLGPQTLRLASGYQRAIQVRSVIDPVVSTLSATLNATASFYVRSGDRRVLVSRSERCKGVLGVDSAGEDFDLATGAAAAVLKAFPAGDDIASGHAVRERCWAVSYGEVDPNLAAAAVPVFGTCSELHGTLVVSAPLSKLERPEAMYAALCSLFEAASRATEALGGDSALLTESRNSLSLLAIANAMG